MSSSESHEDLNYLKRNSIVCASVVIIIALLGLLGYLSGLRFLGSIHPEFIPMAPSTALSFFILSIIIILGLCRKRNLAIKLLVLLCVSFVLIFGLLKFIEYFTGGMLTFENVVVGDMGRLGEIPIGIMSPATGMGFFLAGLIVLCISLKDIQKKYEKVSGNMAGVLAVAIIMGGCTFMLSYFHKEPLFYGQGSVVPMALTTAIAFLFLGFSFVFNLGDEYFPLDVLSGFKTESRITRVFLPLIVVVILVENGIFCMIHNAVHDELLNSMVIVIFALLVGFIAFLLSRVLGGEIDKAVEARRKAENALEALAITFSGVSSEDFFDEVVECIARTLNVEYAFIGELISERNAVKIVSGFGKGKKLDSFEYDLKDTPCENVIGKKACLYSRGVQELFPKDRLLIDMEIEGYLGAPLFNKEGSPIGIMVVLCEKPIENQVVFENLFRVFVDRVCAEMERSIVLKNLKKYRDELEDEVQRRTSQLIEARKELEEKKRLADIGALSATLAHELRNPLAGIKVAMYNLTRKEKQDQQRHVNTINHKISECDVIIRNFLSYAKISTPHYENVVIRDILEESIKTMEKKYQGVDVDIQIKSCCDECEEIEADKIHLLELFYNILDNAYQAFSDRRGRIDIESECSNENKCKIVFTDNGVGIEKENLEKIFEPFFTTKIRGIGLGMTVCRQVVDLHRGKIDVQSELGQGTTISICLPMKKPGSNDG